MIQEVRIGGGKCWLGLSNSGGKSCIHEIDLSDSGGKSCIHETRSIVILTFVFVAFVTKKKS